MSLSKNEDVGLRVAVSAFLRRHRAVAALLHEGLDEFDVLSGRDVPARLALCQGAEEDDAVLRVVWQMRPGEDGGQLLRTFDTCWWLRECHRSEGRLVFDYALESPDGSCGGGINGREYVAHLGL